MIYTVTFNPALDYIMRFKNYTPGIVNRSQSEDIYVGGKGINVSLVLKELSSDSKALGFTAGFTGEVIEKQLKATGIKTDFVRLQNGFSRINVKLKETEETDLNACGPAITENDTNKLFEKLDALNSGDILIISGSIPPSLPNNIYERMLSRLENKNIRFVVDATGDLLSGVLKYKPFLIKPNNFELSEIFSRELKTDAEIEECARELQKKGAKNVLVSMARDGALLADENGVCHKIGTSPGTVKNSVGAGDSMVAGFLAGFLQKGDYEYALKLGTAAGSATAFSDRLAKREDILDLLDKL